MRVIGTAGHVDHGKSTLVEALTGINPDRLREEQERQMTIDLGFAWMHLPGGDEVGVVDVPGHRDFIENMLAGVGGIDGALLVVAADEGLMPQTLEHLAILDLLEVERAVVALTKTDAVDDPGWLDLVRDEVRNALAPTRLAQAELVGVSARTGEGLDDLRRALDDMLRTAPPRTDRGRPRLPIDRAFTLSGFGTVVTGTLLDGSFDVGQEVVVLPRDLHGRIRGLQTHKSKVTRAVPGSRTAANLSGIDLQAVARGDVLALPGSYRATRRLDVHVRLLADAPGPLRHDQLVKVFLGAAQRMARVRVLGTEQVEPGEEGWLQLVLREPVVAAPGDRYIVRQPSPGATLGGGRVVDAEPSRVHRRRDPAALEALQRRLAGPPEDVLEQALIALGPGPIRDAIERAHLDTTSASAAVASLLQSGRLVVLEAGRGQPEGETPVAALASWEAIGRRLVEAVSAYHRTYPLRSGMPPEELKSKLGGDARLRASILQLAGQSGLVEVVAGRIALPGRRVALDAATSGSAEALLDRFRRAQAAPPSYKECLEQVGDELLGYLLESRRLVQASNEVVFEAEAYDRMVGAVRQAIGRQGTVTVADVRDLFGTSRKYALALLEHLDSIGVTVREGDARRLGQTDAQSPAGQAC